LRTCVQFFSASTLIVLDARPTGLHPRSPMQLSTDLCGDAVLASRFARPQGIAGIVILNCNGGQITLYCLESVPKIDYPNFRVIVVDNASRAPLTQGRGRL